jgi:signal transduction histidine kinase
MIYFLGSFVVAIVFLGVKYVLKYGKRDPVTIAFFFCFCGIVLWMSSVFIVSYYIQSEKIILFISKLSFMGMAVIPPSLIVYSSCFPNKKMKIASLEIIFIFIIPALIFAMSYYVVVFAQRISGTSVLLGYHVFWHKVFAIYFFCYLIAWFVAILKNIKLLEGTNRLRLKYFFVSCLITAVVGSVTNLILPLKGIRTFVSYGPLFVSFVVIAQLYTLPKGRLRDINLVGSRFLSTVVVLVLFGGGYSLLVFGLRVFFVNIDGYAQLFVSGIYWVVSCLVFNKVKQNIRREVYSIVLSRGYDHKDMMIKFTRDVAGCEGFSSVSSFVMEFFDKNLGVKKVRFYLPAHTHEEEFDGMGSFVLWDEKLEAPDAIEKDMMELPTDLLGERLLVFNEIENISSELLRFKELYQVYLPCRVEGRLVCALLFGGRNLKEVYTKEDIAFFKTVGVQVAMSFERSLSYERVKKDYKKSLLVAERMSKQASYATLALSVAHDIKNPLRIIRTGMDAVLDNIEDKKSLCQYADSVKRSIIRLSKIIGTTLNYGMVVSNKIEDVSLSNLIEEMILLASAECEKRNIKVYYPKIELPNIKADSDSLSYSFLNIFLNAIEAIEENGDISINTSIESFAGLDGQEGRWVKVEIQDNGCGMSGQELNKIFESFYSTKPKHIGLGLSMAKKVIEEHGGEISVAFNVGQGSRFIVHLQAD